MILFPQTLPLPLSGGRNLAPACPGLASGPWQTGIALGSPAEVLQLVSHFHTVAGARLGEVPPTQARAGTSRGEQGWSHVLLSHPSAGAASPELLRSPPRDAWPMGGGGLAPAPAPVSATWLGSAGMVAV